MLDEQKMLQLIASEPMLRTVQLADRLDCDIDDIEDALLPMVNRGRVVRHEVIAPDKRRASAYTLSDERRNELLREAPGVAIDVLAPPIAALPHPIERAVAFITEHGTVTGGQLHAFLGLEAAEIPSNVLAEALADGRLFKDGKFWTLGAASRCRIAAEVPREQISAAPCLTAKMPKIGKKAQLAIDFIAKQERATDVQLAEVMGLREGDPPEAWLREALKFGVVARDGANWILGARPVPPVEVPRAPEAVKPAPAPLSIPVLSTHEPRTPRATPTPPASFRCGVWSDGLLELQRDGKVIAALSPDEYAQVAEFLTRRTA